MRFIILLASCATAVATLDSLSEASVEQTQEILRGWDLHQRFGAEFLELRYDGRFLQKLDMSDFDKKLFPRATRAHWKVLLGEIEASQPQRPASRRLAKADFSKFQGVHIQRDNAILTFGAKNDVKVARTGPSQLSLSGSLSADSLSAKKLILNGKAVGGQIKLLSSIPAMLDRLGKLEAITKGIKDKNKIALGAKGDVSLARTGAGQAKLTGVLTTNKDVKVGGDLSAKNIKVATDLSANRIKGNALNVNGAVRITDDIRMAGPHRGDPGTIGYVYAKGILKPGQSSPSQYSNPNYWSGNGKVSITVCSMHSEGKTGGGSSGSDHVYKVYWNSHGQPYNHYSQPMLKHLKSSDGKLTLTGGAGCVFKNGHASHEAYWVIKQLPVTSFSSTRHAAKGTGAWAI